MTDDQYLLASAYLDGDVTPNERAAAEADPAVMAEVARLRDLQIALRSVEPPSADTRAAMIGAALAEFQPTAQPLAAPSPASALSPSPSPMTSAGSRRAARWSTWERGLGLAAAAVAVLAVGAVVVTGLRGGGSDDDSASSAPTEGLEQTEIAADGRSAGPEASPGSAEVMLDAADTAAGDDADAGGAPAAPEASEPADLAIASATEAPAETDAPSGAGSHAESLADSGRVLASVDELAAYGQELLELGAAEPDATYTDPDCVAATGVDADPESTRFYAHAMYRTDDIDLPVIIAVDPASGQTLAVEVGPPCTLVAAAAAP